MATMRKPITLTLLALALLGSLPAQAQDALVTKRQTTLREGPTDNAAAVATLPAQTALTRQPTRQGPWVQVKTAAGASGWIHLFDVGTATEQGSVASAATGALRGLSNLFNRGSAQNQNTSGTTATVGIRGLGAEDIANAQPNLAALAQYGDVNITEDDDLIITTVGPIALNGVNLDATLVATNTPSFTGVISTNGNVLVDTISGSIRCCTSSRAWRKALPFAPPHHLCMFPV